MQEIWKDIEDYEGLYQVSNYGRVKSLRKLVSRPKGSYYKKEQFLSLKRDNGYGYLTCRLFKNKSKICFYMHRLVAQAFLNKIENKNDVNHIDANRKNNKVNNLEWCTRKENIHHTIKLGRKNDFGINSCNSNLNENDVINIYNLANSKTMTQSQIGKLYNISQSKVSFIKYVRSYKSIINKYLDSIVDGRVRAIKTEVVNDEIVCTVIFPNEVEN